MYDCWMTSQMHDDRQTALLATHKGGEPRYPGTYDACKRWPNGVWQASMWAAGSCILQPQPWLHAPQGFTLHQKATIAWSRGGQGEG
jgi:hypothetical protein